jgi:streptogramin lyase
MRRDAAAMTSTTNWTCAAVVGALVGAVFWAIAVHAIMASEGAVAVYAGIGIFALAAIAAGAVLYRRRGSQQSRSLGAGLILAPLTGAAPLVAFSLAGLVFELIRGFGR